MAAKKSDTAPQGSEAADEAAHSEVTPADEALAAAFEQEVAAANRRADENWDKYLRAEAELDNFRKLAERRRIEAIERERRRLLAEILTVSDNLERALAHSDAGMEALLQGVHATHRELHRTLEAAGVTPIAAEGSNFDPDVHEAVSVVPLAGADHETVVSVERPGYMLGDELLRPARVVVGQPQRDS